MAPKHGLRASSATEGGLAKRAKSSGTPASRSATPAEVEPKETVPFEVHYPITTPSLKKKLSKTKYEKNEEMAKNAELQVSPFEAKGAAPGALDQRFTVTPAKQWEDMKKYSNFVSEYCTDLALVLNCCLHMISPEGGL